MERSFDVIIVGGSLAGTATAYQIKKEHPLAKIAIIEKSTSFKRRVGESTVEVSSLFLTETLGLSHHLSFEHIQKQGLRFWFYNKKSKSVEQCRELGPKYNVKLNTYQVERAKLDQEMLNRCNEIDISILRPYTVKDIQFGKSENHITISCSNGETSILTSKWVVDASGSACFVGRKKGWYKVNDNHPVGAYWSRYKLNTNLEEIKRNSSCKSFRSRCYGQRDLSTNHLMGDGWWSWIIPLKNGETSIGLVFDHRILKPKQMPKKEIYEFIKETLSKHPLGKELLKGAEAVADDLNYRKQIAYSNTTFIQKGVALVGDAAAMIDPFYSPGLDWLSHTTTAFSALIAKDLKKGVKSSQIEKVNEEFLRSYRRWFECLYKDKYYYLGDSRLMGFGFLMDLCLYYIGVVTGPYLKGAKNLSHPPFGHKIAYPAFAFIRFYNQRLVSLAKKWRERNVFGTQNHKSNEMIESYSFGPKLFIRFSFLMLRFIKINLMSPFQFKN